MGERVSLRLQHPPKGKSIGLPFFQPCQNQERPIRYLSLYKTI